MDLFAADALTGWTASLLVAHGLPPAHADIAADALVDADLRGIGTHGVAQLPGYCDWLRRGVTNPRPDIRVSAQGSVLAVDADRALGQVAGITALDAAVAAADSGVAIAAIRRSGHLGALGYFARRAAEAGMVAIVMQNGPPLMALPGMTRRAIGNNPIAFAAPVPGKPPLVFDMAASEAAYGKVLAAAAAGEELPEGWALDAEGRPTRDAQAAATGMLLPVAGAKGIGLAMMVECLAGSLSGTRPVWGSGLFGGFLMVARPGAATEPAAFASDIETWLAHYAGSGPDARYPGERAAAMHAERLAGGIPLAAGVAEKLAEAGGRAGVPFVRAIDTAERGTA